MFEFRRPDVAVARASQNARRTPATLAWCKAIELAWWRGLLVVLLGAAPLLAHATDIYGYVDERGVAHLSAEKLDARYRLFFRDGRSFDTADLASGGKAAAGTPPSAARALLELVERAPGYRAARAAISAAADQHAVDVELLQALIATESGFDARAVSPKGALGLMQLMPETAQRYGVRGDRQRSVEAKLFDPQTNIAAGARYLRDLIAMFPGQLELALAAYNAGEGAVQRAGNRIPDYRETQNYVHTVLQLYEWLKPGGAARARGGKAPVRVRMELPPPTAAALERDGPRTAARADLPAVPGQPTAEGGD